VGHLFPKKGKHRGYIVFSKTTYGDAVLLDSDFENTESSPWLHEAVTDLIFELDVAEGTHIWRGYCIPKKVMVRAAIDEYGEDEYAGVVVLKGKVVSSKTFAEMLQE